MKIENENWKRMWKGKVKKRYEWVSYNLFGVRNEKALCDSIRKKPHRAYQKISGGVGRGIGLGFNIL
jgi:muconolactone delta-isomerase